MARSTPPTREAQLARFVLTRNLRVQPGENVIVEGWSHSLPWSVALVREARRLGAHPLLIYEDEAAFWDSVDAKEDAVLGAAPTHEWAALGKTDVYIHLWNVGDRIRMGALPPARVNRIFGFNDKWYDVAHKAKLRGTRLDIGRPFPNLAEAYGVDLETWTQQIFEGAMVDPAELERRGEPIAKALERGREIRIHDDDGTDLTLRLSGGEPVRDYGRVTAADRASRFRLLNFLPAGAVRIALDSRVAEGTFRANRASFSETGKATGGVFTFQGGRLSDHQFATGGAELFDMPYRRGGTGRDRPGYLSIGLNPKLPNTPQLEDREAGAILVSVGGNAFLPGGKNKSNFGGIAINAGATVEVDGRPLRLPR